mmetsp:Transcript_26144/g.34930  ORF Transcript_26144/g.34930 Transcript_26144/m.34930 type:complete len:226 (-) Transcript_26144:128-805(-)
MLLFAFLSFLNFVLQYLAVDFELGHVVSYLLVLEPISALSLIIGAYLCMVLPLHLSQLLNLLVHANFVFLVELAIGFLSLCSEIELLLQLGYLDLQVAIGVLQHEQARRLRFPQLSVRLVKQLLHFFVPLFFVDQLKATIVFLFVKVFDHLSCFVVVLPEVFQLSVCMEHPRRQLLFLNLIGIHTRGRLGQLGFQVGNFSLSIRKLLFSVVESVRSLAQLPERLL